jgi:hypothetical protein
VNGSPSPGSWVQRIFQALVLVLLVAFAARLAYDVLSPLVPGLVVLVLLGVIFWLLFRRRS